MKEILLHETVNQDTRPQPTIVYHKIFGYCLLNRTSNISNQSTFSDLSANDMSIQFGILWIYIWY